MRQTVKNELLPRTTQGMNLSTNMQAVLNPGPNTTVTPVLQRFYAFPIYLHRAILVTNLAVRVSAAAAGSSMAIAQFTNNDATQPWSYSRINTFGQVSTDVTGEVSLTGTWTMPAGFSWLAYYVIGGTPTLEATDGIPRIPGFVPMEAASWAGEEFKTLKYGADTYVAMVSSFIGSGLNLTTPPARVAVKGTVIA